MDPDGRCIFSLNMGIFQCFPIEHGDFPLFPCWKWWFSTVFLKGRELCCFVRRMAPAEIWKRLTSVEASDRIGCKLTNLNCPQSTWCVCFFLGPLYVQLSKHALKERFHGWQLCWKMLKTVCSDGTPPKATPLFECWCSSGLVLHCSPDSFSYA